MEGIIRAAKAADAHNFISQLPDGYETLVSIKWQMLVSSMLCIISFINAVSTFHCHQSIMNY